MLNAVRRFWKRSVPVTLKRPNAPGLNYREVMDLLNGLNMRKVRDGHYLVKIDADDLIILLKAHAVKIAEAVEEELSGGVKTSEGYIPKLAAMWGEEKELGMSEWLEIVPVPGVNFATVYRYERSFRSGQ